MILEHLSMCLPQGQLHDKLDRLFAVHVIFFLDIEKRERDENYNNNFKELLNFILTIYCGRVILVSSK